MLPASRLSWATLLAITSLCTACAARYSVPSEQLADRDLTKPVEVVHDGKTSTTRVLSVEAGDRVHAPGAIAEITPQPGERWIIETTNTNTAGIAAGTVLGALMGVIGGTVLMLACQGGSGGSDNVCPVHIAWLAGVGGLAGLGLGAAVSASSTEAELAPSTRSTP